MSASPDVPRQGDAGILTVLHVQALEPRRRLLHRQLAEILLTQEAAAGTVATHYAASDRPWLALEPALTAAQQAGHLTAYDEALAWCQQAMDIAEAHPQAVPAGFRTRLHLQWRTLWYYRGDLERTLAADRAALAAARREGDPASELEALWHLAHDETQVAAGGPSGLQAEALALAHDLGQSLGCGAHLGALVRLQSGHFALEDAVSLARLPCTPIPLAISTNPSTGSVRSMWG